MFQTGEGEEFIDATDEFTPGECSFNYQAIFISATSEIVGVVVTGGFNRDDTHEVERSSLFVCYS